MNLLKHCHKEEETHPAQKETDRYHTDALSCGKTLPTKYWVHKCTDFSEVGHFCIENVFLMILF